MIPEMVCASEGNKRTPTIQTTPRYKSMAVLTEGSEFLTSKSQNGFTEYIDQTGLVQNKNVDYNTSEKKCPGSMALRETTESPLHPRALINGC